MTNIRQIICLFLTIIAVGCSSGSSSPEPRPETPTGVVSDPLAPSEPDHSGGYLYGELYLDDTQNSAFPIQILLTEDGRFRALQFGPYGYPLTYLLLRGTYELQGRTIVGHGIAIASDGEAWSDGGAVTGLTMSGTLDRPTNTNWGKLLATVSMDSGDSGRIEATFAALSPYYFGSDLERLAGTWVGEQAENGSWYPDPYRSADPPLPPPGVAVIVFSPDGSFSGSSDDGCLTAGNAALIDTRFSAWSIEYTISGCSRAGDYSGLLLGDNYWYSIRSLRLSADDGLRSQSLEFWQQSP